MTFLKFPMRGPAIVFSSAAVLAAGGVVVQSCNPAMTTFLVPVCSGDPMLIEVGRSGMVHCSGCYAAITGLAGMLVSAAWGILSTGILDFKALKESF